MLSTAGPSRTMRPRRSSALTPNGRIVSSMPVWSGSRTGMAKSGLFIGHNIRGQAPNLRSPLPAERPASTAVGVQAPGQNPLLRMQPVFGLVEHPRMRTVDHLVGDLLAAVCGQAMHEDGVRLGPGH